MAWIEVHQSLPTHRKARRLARELKFKNSAKASTVGHLVMLWLWAIDNAPSGDLSEIDSYDIADAADWPGDPDKFVQALKVAGFVDADGHIHDWDVYIGKLIDRREANAQRMRTARARKKGTCGERAEHDEAGRADTSVQNVHGTCGERAEHVRNSRAQACIATVPNPTVPNPTVPNPTVPNPTVPNRGSSSEDPPRAREDCEEEKFPPSAGEVEDYIREHGLDVDAREFIERCEAAGWKDGKGEPVTNWRLWLKGYAIRTARPEGGRVQRLGMDPRLAALEAMKGGRG